MSTRCDFCPSKADNSAPVLKSVKCVKESSGRTLLDHVFYFICFINGLIAPVTPTRRQESLLKLIWFWISVSYACIALNDVRNSVGQAKKVNLIFIIEKLNTVFYPPTNLYVAWVFLTRRELLVTLLQSNKRRVIDIVIPVATVIPFAAAILFLWGGSDISFVLYRGCLVHCLSIIAGFSIIYTDVLRNNHELLSEISSSARKLQLTTLAQKKWHAREQIRKTNDIFARPLCLYYFQALMVIVTFFSQLLSQKTELGFWLTVFPGCFSFVIPFWLHACKSSDNKALCHDTEALFSRVIDTTEIVCVNCQAKYLRLLKYREEWDSLKVGCFSQSVPNFLYFKVTCFTCLAIVLQFDFKVMSAMSKLAS